MSKFKAVAGAILANKLARTLIAAVIGGALVMAGIPGATQYVGDTLEVVAAVLPVLDQ